MAELKTDVLYFGDNLEILRKYIPDNSIDLIYLDPPFNSKKDYNILFKENGGVESEAQTHAFTDSWHWTPSAYNTYQEIILKGPDKVSKLISALHDSIGNNDVMAYLVMMTIRLVEMHRILKSTGSLYIHCDPTTSHYLKLVLDQIFGPTNFKNEIIWKRINAKSNVQRKFGAIHDVILVYPKEVGSELWNQLYRPLDAEYVETNYRYVEQGTGRRYSMADLTASMQRASAGQIYEWRGKRPPASRCWVHAKDKMDELDRQGLIVFSSSGNPRLKHYLDENDGERVPDIWDDIPPVQSQAQERLGYDTQKPLALLERIIQASSNEGDVVLDPFCGCGTAVVAAQKLNRKWIGIDITHLAINLMKRRLKDSFGIKPEVIGEPKDLAGAKELASQKDKYQFQWWALDLVDAHPAGGGKKKGADKGIDGIIPFIDDPTGKASRVIVQVKSGHIGVNAVKELEATVKNEAIGVLITLEPPTAPMKVEAVEAGYYHSPLYDKDYPKIQILTIEELFQGKKVDMPPQTQTSVAFAKAPRITKKEGKQLAME